jgi:hypothetical protein
MTEDKEAQLSVEGDVRPDAPHRATLPAGPHARSKVDANQEAKDAVENKDTTEPPKQATLPAGPHARSKVTDNDKTPRTGALPSTTAGGDVDVGSD